MGRYYWCRDLSKKGRPYVYIYDRNEARYIARFLPKDIDLAVQIVESLNENARDVVIARQRISELRAA